MTPGLRPGSRFDQNKDAIVDGVSRLLEVESPAEPIVKIAATRVERSSTIRAH